MKRNEIEQLLPSIVRRTTYPASPLVAVLDAMEALHAPAEEVLNNLSTYLDPYQAPDHLLPYLAHWVDLGRFLLESPNLGPQDDMGPAADPFPPGLGRLRDLISRATELWQWRGTRRGMLGLLETATGIKGFEIVENTGSFTGLPAGDLAADGPRPFHLVVRAPAEAKPYQRLIEQILEMEKPAYVTYELHVSS